MSKRGDSIATVTRGLCAYQPARNDDSINICNQKIPDRIFFSVWLGLEVFRDLLVRRGHLFMFSELTDRYHYEDSFIKPSVYKLTSICQLHSSVFIYTFLGNCTVKTYGLWRVEPSFSLIIMFRKKCNLALKRAHLPWDAQSIIYADQCGSMKIWSKMWPNFLRSAFLSKTLVRGRMGAETKSGVSRWLWSQVGGSCPLYKCEAPWATGDMGMKSLITYWSASRIFPSRVSGRGYKIGPVCVCVCLSVRLSALSWLILHVKSFVMSPGHN